MANNVAPGLTTYQLPQLPQDLAKNLSTAQFSISLREASDYPGYATARARFVELFIGGRLLPMGLTRQSSVYGPAPL
jgi:hypothetical protein